MVRTALLIDAFALATSRAPLGVADTMPGPPIMPPPQALTLTNAGQPAMSVPFPRSKGYHHAPMS